MLKLHKFNNFLRNLGSKATLNHIIIINISRYTLILAEGFVSFVALIKLRKHNKYGKRETLGKWLV